MKKTLYLLLASFAITVGAASCNDDHNPDWKSAAPYDVTVESTSIADGSTVTATEAALDVTYSAAIAFNSLATVTLNGEPLPNQANSVAVDGATLHISLPDLQAGREYVLVIPDRAVTGIGAMTFAPEVSIRFTTEGNAPSAFSDLVNPNATREAKNVYEFLVENHGKTILSGAMANVNNNNDFASWIKSNTGKDVAITCYDFIHLPQSGANWIDYSDTTPAETQWNANGLVSYMWHWTVPTDEQAWKDKDYSRYGYRPAGSEESSTGFDIDRALEEGTWEHEFIIEDLGKVAGVIKQLQDKGIPVIWRPLHEAAGDYEYRNPWFWWGAKGGESTKKLWRLMYDQLVNVHGCNNLIWVWTAQYKAGYTEEMANDYPGNEYVDIVGTDIYADSDDSQSAAYSALAAMTGGKKLVAISETGLVQNPEKCLADKAWWSWFNIWYTYDIHTGESDTDSFGNTAESLRGILESPYVTNRDKMPSLK